MTKLFRIFIAAFLLFLLELAPASGQNQQIQDLLSSLESLPDNEQKVTVLIRLSNLVRRSDVRASIDYANDAVKLAERLNFTGGIGQGNYVLGMAYAQDQRMSRALRFMEQALPYYDKLENRDIRIQFYNDLASIYSRQGKKIEAAAYQERAQNLRQQESQIIAEEKISELQEQNVQQRNVVAQTKKELEEQTELALRRELEIVQLESDAYQLELEKTRLSEENLMQELALEKAQMRMYWLIGGAVFLLMLTLAFILRNRMLREKRKAAVEQHRAEQLQQIDKIKDQFLANTSHELKTPLNGIIGIAEYLLDHLDESTKEDRTQNLGMIISSGRRLSNLVNDLLDFSKMRNDTLHLNLKSIDLRAIAEVVLRINMHMAVNKNLKFENTIPADLPAAYADEDRLQQILHNLVGNAIKFTPNGKVTIGAEDEGDEIKVWIKDTGIGIPEEEKNTIFEAFVQADGSISRQYSGTGLGLAITRQIIEMHEGRIWVESDVGKGSTFFFSLPKSHESAVPIVEEDFVARPLESFELRTDNHDDDKLATQLTAEDSYRILIVDDEPINQQVLKNHLSIGKYNITIVNGGSDALKALEENPRYDLVLLDIMMPKMSGYEVCQRIREKYVPSELPIIMVTAKNQVEDLVTGLSFGANDYIAKPFSKDELLARIRTHLNLNYIHSATNRFVPSEFLQTLGYQSITDVQLGDHVLKEVTVLFSDIRDYTALSETLSPEENFNFVNSFTARMGPVIQKYGGFVHQYMGDGIMAIFLEGADKALQAAVEMHEVLTQYNIERERTNRKVLRMGIGLHSGPLIMGVIGDKHRSDTATISDTVNTASRMEGLTKIYGARILVSQSTVAQIINLSDYRYRSLGKVRVKGKTTAVGVYEFFDAEDTVPRALKLATLDKFDRALVHYFGREFKEAIDLLERVLLENPNDEAAKHYLRRSKANLAEGTDHTWTGVEMMEIK